MSIESDYDALFAFAIITLVIETLAIVIGILNFVIPGKKILLGCLEFLFFFTFSFLLGDKWFLIFHLATFVGCTIFWMIYIILKGDSQGWITLYWYIVVIFIFSILSIVGCLLLIIPCQQKAFKILYLTFTTLHYVFTWIFFMHSCGHPMPMMYDHWTEAQDWISFSLSQFLMITVLYIFEFLIIFGFKVQLSPA